MVGAVSLWRRRAIPGAFALGLAMLAGGWWSLAAALEAAAVPLESKIFFSTLEYGGSTNASAFLLLFALRYRGKTSWARGPKLILLWTIPLLAVPLVATNGFHRLVWVGFSPGPAGSNILRYHHGPAFFAVLAGAYAYVALSSVLLLRAARQGPAVQRRQVTIVLLAVAFPVVAGILYALHLTPVPGLNLTPLSFVFTGATLALGVVPLHLFDLVPVARAALVEIMSDGVLVLDAEHRVVDFNPAAQDLLGFRPQDLGREASSAIPLWPRIASHIAPDREVRFELTVSEEPLFHLDLRVAPLRGRSGPAGFLLVARDLSQRHQAEQLLQKANERLKGQVDEIERLHGELREQVIRDALTGLFNRRPLNATLPQILERAAQDKAEVAVIVFDIDRFKQANDVHGHRAGDALLVTLGRLLTARSRPGDLTCRLGGDEFVLVLPGASLAVAVQRAEEIRRQFRETVPPDLPPDQPFTVSAGIAVFPAHGRTLGDLLSAADGALYTAKKHGRDRVEAAPDPLASPGDIG